MIIKLEQFHGIAPKLAPHLLPETAAQTAENCRFAAGSLQSWMVNLAVSPDPLTKSGTIQSIYLYEGSYWFHWIDNDIKVAQAPIANDSYARVYITGDGAPKITANDVALTGGTDYPMDTYQLGIPIPAAAPTVAAEAYSASATYAIGDEVTYSNAVYRCSTTISAPEAWTSGHWTAVEETELETRSYVYCFVSKYGEEGAPSSASVAITVGPNQHVDLSSFSSTPGGYDGIISYRRIYRTNTGSTTTEYQRVTDLAYATSTYHDNVASASLGDVMPSVEHDAPDSSMTGITSMPGGFFAGYFGRTVCFSVVYQPHAWPISWRIPVDYDIVGMAAFGTSLVVLTEGVPYVFTGTDPSAMSVEKMEIGHACVSSRGIVDMGYTVAYPSPDGIVVAGMGSFTLATEKILSKKEWASYAPSTIHAYLFDGQYVGFYNGTAGFVFHPSSGDFSTLDFYATAGYTDPATGDLYLVVGGDLVKWDAGATRRTYTWKSRPFYTPRPVNMGCAQVFADTYNVTAKIYADGVLIHTQAVTSSLPFRLPAGVLATRWEIELTGAVTVNKVVMATTMAELREAA